MRVSVIGSGSDGNTVILQNNYETLVLDAGMPYKDVVRALDYQVSKIKGVCVTHEHSDHAKYCKDYIKNGFKVFKPYEKFESIKRFGGFTVKPFELVHDVLCYGFYVYHEEVGSLIYATDTEYIKHRFPNINHIFVEMNYDKELADENHAKHIHVLTGHMERNTTLEFIRQNRSEALRNVLLLHPSISALDKEKALRDAQNVAECDVRIAYKGTEFEIEV